jgi:hypothetical protein
MPRKKPLVILKGLRIEIDRKELLLIQTPFSTSDEASKPRTPAQQKTSRQAITQLI